MKARIGSFMRYSPWLLTGLLALLSLPLSIGLAVFWSALFLLGVQDLLQSSHAVRRNYPLTGRLRYALEYIRPEIRQYFVESDEDKLPFSRNQRAIVYARSKLQNDKRGFGTIQDLYHQDTQWLAHSIFPTHPDPANFRVMVGQAQCAQPYAMSVLNVSGMSFGALSGNAIKALNKGAALGGFVHNTGEGSISIHHQHGGDVVWQVASGYFGCRDANGHFDAERFANQATAPFVKMIELKLSQGAKPGHGGVLPGAKVSAEIAQARGVPAGQDCISPARHSAFSDFAGMLAFIAQLRELSGGKPVGLKLCIGNIDEWFSLVKAMLHSGQHPDFITLDGGEGGTGAAPVEFTDHVGMPMREGLRLVHNTLVGAGLRDKIRIGVAGKVISAFDIARCLALGADWCNSARGFMFSLGCIQSRSCHTDHCPTGVATQDPIRQQAVVVTDKAERVHTFHRSTLANLAELLGSAGLNKPDELQASHILMRGENGEIVTLTQRVSTLASGALLQPDVSNLPEPFKSQWRT